MKPNEPTEHWPCDLEGHELQQLRRGAARSFRENLIWLENASELARKLKAAPVHASGTQETSPQKVLAFGSANPHTPTSR